MFSESELSLAEQAGMVHAAGWQVEQTSREAAESRRVQECLSVRV